MRGAADSARRPDTGRRGRRGSPRTLRPRPSGRRPIAFVARIKTAQSHTCRREMPSVRKCGQGVFDQEKGIEIGGEEYCRFPVCRRTVPPQAIVGVLVRRTRFARRLPRTAVQNRGFRPSARGIRYGVFVEIAFHLGPDLFGHPALPRSRTHCKQNIDRGRAMFRNRVQLADSASPFQHDGNRSRFGVGRSQFRCPATPPPEPRSIVLTS